MNFTEQYRKHVADKGEELVDLSLPSGFVMKFAKPSKALILFQYGQLPQGSTSAAVRSWSEKGLLDDLTDDTTKELEAFFVARDQVLELSRVPKLVIGPAQNDKELSTGDLSDEDCMFLIRWCAAGGDAGSQLATFPSGSGADALVSTSRRKVRTKTK